MFKYLDRKWKIRRRTIATLAGLHYYGNPSKRMKIIGVTGTNGKTTIATLLYNLFTKLGYKVGLIGTTGNIIIAEKRPTTYTTPSPKVLNKLLNEMAEKGCQYVFMETSSHAIDQRRIAGIHFAGGIFTNLTQDHLDYHKNMENYFKTKKKFFRNLSRQSFALANVDDEYGYKMLEGIRAQKYLYGLKKEAFFQEYLETKLVGEFNAYNVLAVYATAVLLGEEKEKVKKLIKDLEPAEGRFNAIKSATDIFGIVDFAHTPDALENVLNTIQKLKKGDERIITVFGCGGGDRKDHFKRPIMTKTAYDLSDIIIPTADNPREEDIENIFTDMKKGLPNEVKKEVHFIADRSEAIKKACELAHPGDYILLAGKGHEKYQEVKGIKHPFNDMEELKKFLI